jgi:hypothetical protein
MFTIPEAIRNNLVGILIGAGVTWLLTRLQAKTARLRYSTRVEKLGSTTEDPIFGSMAVSWSGKPLRNLYMASVEIENESTRDFENIPLKVFVAQETFLLNERAAVVNAPYAILWTPEYIALIAVKPGGNPTAQQEQTYYHNREYRVPVLNRGQILHFNYLCTRPNDDIQPEVYVDTQIKGARLRRQNRSNMLYGVPVQIALIRGLIIALVIAVICGTAVHNVWIAIAISMLVGLSSQLLGIAEYKAERWMLSRAFGGCARYPIRW